MQEAAEAAKASASQARDVARSTEQSVSHLRRDIQELERQARNGGGHPAAFWHAQAPKLLDLIDRNRNRFDRVPFGPLGMHVGNSDERCAASPCPAWRMAPCRLHLRGESGG
jgi:hypothetical protein